MKLNHAFIDEVLAIANKIPYGRVTTYGNIAKLIGCDKNSRLVGKILGLSGTFGDYPCHRVVNSAGKLVNGWKEQRTLLIREGITFKTNGNVDLNKHLWKGE